MINDEEKQKRNKPNIFFSDINKNHHNKWNHQQKIKSSSTKANTSSFYVHAWGLYAELSTDVVQLPRNTQFSSLHCEEPRSHKRVNTQVSGTFPLLSTYIRLAVAAWLGLDSYTEWKNVTQWT